MIVVVGVVVLGLRIESAVVFGLGMGMAAVVAMVELGLVGSGVVTEVL